MDLSGKKLLLKELICLAENLIRIFLTNIKYMYFLASSSWPGEMLVHFLQFPYSGARKLSPSYPVWAMHSGYSPTAYTLYTLHLHAYKTIQG